MEHLKAAGGLNRGWDLALERGATSRASLQYITILSLPVLYGATEICTCYLANADQNSPIGQAGA